MSASSKLFSSDDKRVRAADEIGDSVSIGNHLRLNTFSSHRSGNRAGSPLTAIHGAHIPSLTRRRLSGLSHGNSRPFGRYQNGTRTAQIASPVLQSNNSNANTNTNTNIGNNNLSSISVGSSNVHNNEMNNMNSISSMNNFRHHNGNNGNSNGNVNGNGNVQSNRLGTTVSSVVRDVSPVNTTSHSSSVYQTHRRRSRTRMSPAVLSLCLFFYCFLFCWFKHKP